MRWSLAFVIVCALSSVSLAQETPVAFRLLMETTELHTGQPYTVSLRIDASDIWAFSAKIEYDPALLYIIGTQTGQPIKPVPALNNADGMTIFNRLQGNQIEFVYSRLSPAQSAHYSDTVATFQIYPLRAGTTLLKVASAEVNRISFKLEGDQRMIDTQTSLPMGANELTLTITITGDPVQPPLEVTVTPAPQLIATTNFGGVDMSSQATSSAPTLIPLNNMTPIAPLVTAETPKPPETPQLAMALGLIAFALMGLLSLWLSSRRR